MKAVLFRNLLEDGSFSMQRYALELAQAMRSVGSDRWHVRQFICRQPQITAKVIPNRHGGRIDNALTRYVLYPFQAARLPGDIFHILDHGYAQLVLGLDRRRTVVTCHDLIPLLAHTGLIPMTIPRSVVYTIKFRLYCLTRAAYIIAISESTKRDLLRFAKMPSQRVIVIPYGLSKIFSPEDNPEAVQTIQHRLGIPRDAKIVLHVGTRGHYKNMPVLLRALHRLNASMNLNVWLLRIGADFRADEVTLIDELGLKNKVIEVGRVLNDEYLASYYRAVDLLVFPSLWEGFGWPPLEAMACGTPVVTSNAASLPEVVGDAGLMVDPQDYNGLAQAIRAVLMNDDLRQSLIARGLARAQQFTWEQTARQTLAVYERVAREFHG